MNTKKYSVNIENDEVVSVEVDGIQYASPEEIPDPEDREKIHRLITRSTEEQLDEIFDDEEFQKEFQEIQKKSSLFPTLFAAIFLSLAGVLLAIAAVSAWNAFQLQAREQSTPGQVVDLVVRTSRDQETNRLEEFSYPVIEFALPGQPRQVVELSQGSSPPAYSIGDQVTILYDPQNPGDVRIKSISSTMLLWLLPAITFVVGAVFLAVALIVIKLRSAQQHDFAAVEQI